MDSQLADSQLDGNGTVRIITFVFTALLASTEVSVVIVKLLYLVVQ